MKSITSKLQACAVVAAGLFGAGYLNSLQPAPNHFHATETKKTEVYEAAYKKYSADLKRAASLTEQKFMVRNMACFAPGTDPEIVAAFQAAMAQYLNQQDYIAISRWPGSVGTSKALTWSFVPDGLSLINAFYTGIGEGDTPSDLFAKFDTLFASQGGRAHWVSRFTACFARWQQLSGITFTRVTSGGNDWDDGAFFHGVSGGAAGLRGDIRIGGHFIDGPGGVLAYAYYPTDGEMVIDTGETTNYSSTTNFNRSFRNIVVHELGHSTGFDHVNSATNIFLMEPFLTTSVDGPQQTDIRGVNFLYGDTFENNQTAGAAANLGSFNSGTFTFGDVPADAVGAGLPIPSNSAVLSISTNGDLDFYKITVPMGGTMTATAQPIGSNYSIGPDGGPESNLNALTITPLSIQILAPDGTTSLAFKAANVAGEAPTTPVANLASAGTYFIRVAELSAPNQSQLYKLSFTLTLNNDPPNLTSPGNKVVNEGANLAFSLSATDPNASQVLMYSMTGAPSGATLDSSTGAFSWTPSEAQGPGVYNVTFTATDNGSPAQSDSESISITVNEVNQNPTLLWTTPNGISIVEGSSLIFDANASDPDLPANTLTFSIPTAPAGATINPTTGIFSWTPSPAQAPGSYPLTVRVSDGLGGTSQRSITVNAVFSTKTIKGDLNMDFWPVARYEDLELQIQVRPVGSTTPLYSTSISSTGTSLTFDTNDIPAGNYDIWIKTKIHVAVLHSNVAVSNGGAQLPKTTLLSGDCDNTNAVTTDDYLVFSNSFDLAEGDPGYDARADSDGNRVITTDDYLAISTNFDITGPD